MCVFGPMKRFVLHGFIHFIFGWHDVEFIQPQRESLGGEMLDFYAGTPGAYISHAWQSTN